MICNVCSEAADYNNQARHRKCKGCDCHHKPIVGEARLKRDEVVELWESRACTCLHCDKVVALNKDGRMRKHKESGKWTCPGSGVVHA